MRLYAGIRNISVVVFKDLNRSVAFIPETN